MSYKGYEIYKVYEDVDISAKTDNTRPAFEELLQDIKDKKCNTIDIYKDKVPKLQKTLDYFKELWKKFIKFLQDNYFSSNKYDDLIDELYEEEIIDDDLEVIQNEFSSYNSKDDDLER